LDDDDDEDLDQEIGGDTAKTKSQEALKVTEVCIEMS
jgi:hypothetical protein